MGNKDVAESLRQVSYPTPLFPAARPSGWSRWHGTASPSAARLEPTPKGILIV